jgi:hypothetical protein
MLSSSHAKGSNTSATGDGRCGLFVEASARGMELSPASGRLPTPQAASGDQSADQSEVRESDVAAGYDAVERRAAIAALFHIEKAIGSPTGVLSPNAAAAARGVMHDPRALIQYVRASENKPDTAAALIIASATAGDSSDEASGRSSGGDATRVQPAFTPAAPRLDAGGTGAGSSSDASSEGGALATPEMLAEITGLNLDEAMVLLEASGGDLSAAVTLHLENAQVRTPAPCSPLQAAASALGTSATTTVPPLHTPFPPPTHVVSPRAHTPFALSPILHTLRRRASCGAARRAGRTSVGRPVPRRRRRPKWAP